MEADGGSDSRRLMPTNCQRGERGPGPTTRVINTGFRRGRSRKQDIFLVDSGYRQNDPAYRCIRADAP
jgi:hypothetical protein